MTATKAPACTVAWETTPRGDQIPRPGPCAGGGNLPRCQLCPNSPCYWRNTTTPATDPWDGSNAQAVPDLDTTGWTEDLTPLPTHLSDTEFAAHVTRLHRDGKCILCGVFTTWISPKGVRCHKSCATTYHRRKAREQAPATTPPAS